MDSTGTLGFVKQFLASPVKTGALVASSKELATVITRRASIPKAKTIVELGPGTGVFTKKILHQLSCNTVFFALEVNPFFVDETRRQCSKAVVYHDTAANVKGYLSRHGVSKCDCIISSLPWAGFRKDLQESMLQQIVDALEPGGEFLTFAYLHSVFFPTARLFHHMLHDKFRRVTTTKIVWKNVPPAFVYYCRK